MGLRVKKPALLLAMGVLVLALAGIGCGDDDSNPAGTGGGGSGGSGGTGGNSGTGGNGGTGGGTAFMCGATACPAPNALAGIIGLMNCCTESDECGLNPTGTDGATCGLIDAPGVLDTSCPDAESTLPLPGCCAAQGICGNQLDAVGLGCVPRPGLRGNPNVTLTGTDDLIPCGDQADAGNTDGGN